MKTTLKIVSLFLAVGVPGAFAADLAGLSLPAAFDALHLFAAFVASLILLTVFSDYDSSSIAASSRKTSRTPRAMARAAHPLAA